MAGAVGGGIGFDPNKLDAQRKLDYTRGQESDAAMHGLQMAGTGASTARAKQDQALQTNAPWLQAQNDFNGLQSEAQRQRAKQGMSNYGMSQQEFEHELGASQLQGFGSQTREQEAGLQSAAEARRMEMFKPFLDKFMTIPPGGGDVPTHVDFGGLTGAEDAAQRAAFGRAKDQAGMIGRSAMNSLAGVMGGRGLTGSGLAANAAGGVINQQANQVGEVNREQAIQGANIARQRASEQYGGEITQRGQDVEAMNSKRNALLGLISGFGGNITARY